MKRWIILLVSVLSILPARHSDLMAACGGPNDCKPPANGCPTGTYWAGCPTCACKPYGRRCPYLFEPPEYRCDIREVSHNWEECYYTMIPGKSDSCRNVQDSTATCASGRRRFDLKDWGCEERQGTSGIQATCIQLNTIKKTVYLNYCN